MLAYGQSLSSGWEGWPALSVLPRHDSLMLGGSVRPRDEAAATWRPVGEPEFRPLTATVQDHSVAGTSQICITLERAPGGAAELRYADGRHRGRGCLHDSDADSTEDRYEFDTRSGHYPSANIPHMVGQPYPLVNWCVAFAIPITPQAQPVAAPITEPTAWDILRAPSPAPVVMSRERPSLLRRLFGMLRRRDR